MSEQVAFINGLSVTEFAGGQDRGVCLALEVVASYPHPVAELTVENVCFLVGVLTGWLKKHQISVSDITYRYATYIFNDETQKWDRSRAISTEQFLELAAQKKLLFVQFDDLGGAIRSDE